MSKPKLDRDTLHTVLSKIPEAEVSISETGPPFMVDVITTHWRDMDEGLRQRKVWQELIDHFSDDDLAKVEFIFTDTPQERAEYERAGKQAQSA